KITGGTARMLSRRPTPASQSKPTATQNSRMALPAATYSALVKHASATQSVDSPPPCGEGLGVGVVVVARVAFNNFDPHPARLRYASAGDPPHKGEGRDRVRRSRWFHSRQTLSRRALQARERFVDLEAACLCLFALLALAFDHILRRAGDEV